MTARQPRLPVKAFERAIRELHGCNSSFLETVRVVETFRGETAWEGDVHIFDLIGHPTAEWCYAWSHTIEGSDRKGYVAVLHEPPIDSPEAAVKAAIVAEHLEKSGS